MLGLRHSGPVEQIAPRKPQPGQGDSNGIYRQPGFVQQEHQRQQPAQQHTAHGSYQGSRDRPAVLALTRGAAEMGQSGKDGGEQRAGQRENRQQGPHQRRAGQQAQPGRRQHDHQGGSHQAAAQVIEDFPAVDERQPVGLLPAAGARHARQQPGQQLPVAANPAMHPPGVHQVMRRVVFDQHDIGNQGHPAMSAFKQVVAEQGVFRDAPGQAGLEGGDFINALAHVNSFAEQVLVDVRYRQGIGVQAGIAGENAGEVRDIGGGRADLGARLQDGITRLDHSRRGQARPVEGVGMGSHQPARGLGRQDRVGVQGDHVAQPGCIFQAPDDHRKGISRAVRRRPVLVGGQDQFVQLVQLAALPLPAHPHALGRVPAARAVEQEKALSAFQARVAAVQALHAIGDLAQQPGIFRQFSHRRIQEIGGQGKAQRRVGVAQVMQLHLAEQRLDNFTGSQQRGDDHQGRLVAWNPGAKVHLGQDARRERLGYAPVHQVDRQAGGRDSRQQQGQ